MNQEKLRIERAVEIAKIYRAKHGDELPVLVITEANTPQERVLVGNFRKKYEKDDQTTFCAILRMDFARRRIGSYQVVTQPTIGGDGTSAMLAVLDVSGGTSRAELFQISRNSDGFECVVPLVSDAEVEGMFSQLLPTVQDHRQVGSLPPMGIQNMDKYLNACTFSLTDAPEPKPKVLKPRVAKPRVLKPRTVETPVVVPAVVEEEDDMFAVLVKAFSS